GAGCFHLRPARSHTRPVARGGHPRGVGPPHGRAPRLVAPPLPRGPPPALDGPDPVRSGPPDPVPELPGLRPCRRTHHRAAGPPLRRPPGSGNVGPAERVRRGTDTPVPPGVGRRQ